MLEYGYECPLCGLTSTEMDGIYAQLMTSHRKSTISDALLKTTGMRIGTPESSPRISGAESITKGPERRNDRPTIDRLGEAAVQRDGRPRTGGTR